MASWLSLLIFGRSLVFPVRLCSFRTLQRGPFVVWIWSCIIDRDGIFFSALEEQEYLTDVRFEFGWFRFVTLCSLKSRFRGIVTSWFQMRIGFRRRFFLSVSFLFLLVKEVWLGRPLVFPVRLCSFCALQWGPFYIYNPALLIVRIAFVPISRSRKIWQLSNSNSVDFILWCSFHWKADFLALRRLVFEWEASFGAGSFFWFRFFL